MPSMTRRVLITAITLTAATSSSVFGGMISSDYFAFRGIRRILLCTNRAYLSSLPDFLSDRQFLELAEEVTVEYLQKVYPRATFTVSAMHISGYNRGMMHDDDSLMVDLRTYTRRLQPAQSAGSSISQPDRVFGISCHTWRRHWPERTAPPIQTSQMAIAVLGENLESSKASIRRALQDVLVPLIQAIAKHNDVRDGL